MWVGKGTTVLVNSSYATDAVGNITSITGYAPTPSTPSGRGGPPRFCYYYDSLDRLVAATGDYSASDGRYGRYDLSMSYDDLWRVTSKSLDLWRHTASHSPRQYAGYSLSYGYGTDDGTRFRLSTIAETHYRVENDTVGARRQTFHRYQYDGSGNLTHEESGHPVAGGAVNWKSGERKLLWDAENRLRALDENGYVYNPQNEMFQNNKTKRSVLQNEMFFLFYKFNYDNQLNQKKIL